MSKRGALVVVEGLDRSGKTSQCQLLKTTLEKEGHQVRYVKFPDRSTPTGQMINSYLTRSTHQDDHSIHLIFAANRWEASQSILDDLARGTTVIVDRYAFSGAVYSAAKDNPDLSLEWAWQPEIGLPRPDLTLFLDLSAEAAAKRGGYGEERYETERMQGRVRRLFEELFGRVGGMNVCVVDAGREMERVAESVLDEAGRVIVAGGGEVGRLGQLKPVM